MIEKNIKFRIFLHEPNKALNVEEFWSKVLLVNKEAIKITKIRGKGIHKNPNYKGSCMIAITDIAVLRKVLAWQNQLIKYYKETDKNKMSQTEMHP